MPESLIKTFINFSLFLNIGFSFAQSEQIDTTNQSEDQQLPSKEISIEDSVANAGTSLGKFEDAYFKADRWNPGVSFPPDDINLLTPQAALEHFIINSRNKNYKQAAYALNLNLLPDDLSQVEASVLAEKLNFVLEQRISISWDELSDRPDGQIDFSTSTNKAIAGKPRRSISFGKTELNNRDINFRLQRIKYKDKSPIWLISPQTVENIEPLYKRFGPRKLDRLIPKWISFEVFRIPVWKLIGTFLLILLSYFLSKIVSHYIRKIFSNTEKYWIKNIAYRLASPAGAAMGILVFYLLLNNLISFTGPLARGLYTLLLISVIGIITWLIMRVIDYVMDFFAEHSVGDLNDEQNAQAKKMMTYISVGRRIFIFVIVFLGASVIFSQFPSLEKLGVSLMASAGIATVVVGIAAQSTLGNIIAGIQIAITKPAKIGDAVIIEDSYGFVEDITFTYMVLKTWDLRRKVIPLKTVVSNSFENLSMTSSQSIGNVEVYADHRIDVSKVRAKFEELLRNSDKWDGDEERAPIVQVSEMDNKALKIRCLCSGKDYPTTWDLHCELREKLVKYIAELEDGFYLTKERVELEDRDIKES
ncbi:mechanosensitive ion channel [Gramella lutea]|uniref:Mechanosensitive ion channel n=1 Tax=Christiangramia lutea TaxID=1607951 RepID=A0A9X2AB82_9FLAO|nr:mechanosensitive ion channel domain-containing protein [Christiangramia lutea]MCH4822868.1 mechanosensitive ion channel [Christiangramia lutea]